MVAPEVLLLTVVLFLAGHLDGRGGFGFGFLLIGCEGFGYLCGPKIKCF